MKFISLIFIGALASFNLHAAEICVSSESDPDGDGYGWEQFATCLVVHTDNGSNDSDGNQSPITPAQALSQSIFDPRSGERIDIERIYWRTQDFAGKSFSGCNGYVVDPAKETDECGSCSSGESFQYEHYEDGNGRLKYSHGRINFEAEFEWGVDEYGLYFGPMSVSAFAEVTESGINQWLEGRQGSIGFYQHCEGLVPSSGSLNTTTPR